MLLFGNWSVLYLFYVECAGSMRPRLLIVFSVFVRSFSFFFLSFLVSPISICLSGYLSSSETQGQLVGKTLQYFSPENIARPKMSRFSD